MKTITTDQITEAVAELAIHAAHDLEPDILDALLAARDRETSPLAKNVLGILLMNADIGSREMIPVCQDTGICTIFAKLGQEVHVDGDLTQAIQAGVEQGYRIGFLRKSVCDVITRKNSGDNIPAIIHYDIVPGDQLKLFFLPKGCGSENMSDLTMLAPSAGLPGALDYIERRVVEVGPNPCPPPLVVGVGIGGTFEKAAVMSKEVLLRPVGDPHPEPAVEKLEAELLTRINNKGVGVHGLGGCNTALAVHIDVHPTHIASLPVAINIQCHSHRHKAVTL